MTVRWQKGQKNQFGIANKPADAPQICGAYAPLRTAQRPVEQAVTPPYAPLQTPPNDPDGRPRRPRVRPADSSPSPRRGQSAEPMRPAGEQAQHTPPPVAAALDNYYANNVCTAADRRQKGTYDLRQAIQPYSRNKRLEKCGNTPVGDVAVVQHTRSGRTTFTGLATCGSVWICPVCVDKIQTKRRAEMDRILRGHVATGGGLLFLTLTLPHYVNDNLSDLLNILMDGCRKLRGDRRVKALEAIRAVEVTYTGNGWHPHVHAILFTDGHLSDAAIADLHGVIFGVWQRHVHRRTGRTVLPELCPLIRADTADVGRYIAKLCVAYEVTGQTTKEGRDGSRTPFQLAADYVKHHDPRDLALWHEYEQVMHGRKQLTWTRGIRLTLDADLMAQADADETTDGADGTPDDAALQEQVLYLIPRETWRIIHRRQGAPASILLTFRRCGVAAGHQAIAALLADAATDHRKRKSFSG